jgi:hypothetical protein
MNTYWPYPINAGIFLLLSPKESGGARGMAFSNVSIAIPYRHFIFGIPKILRK